MRDGEVAKRLGAAQVLGIQGHEEARSQVSAPWTSVVDVEVIRPRGK
jgi:hypothetical protein